MRRLRAILGTLIGLLLIMAGVMIGRRRSAPCAKQRRAEAAAELKAHDSRARGELAEAHARIDKEAIQDVHGDPTGYFNRRPRG